MRNQTGVSLIEVTIILMTLSVLAAIAAPAVEPYLADARLAKARGDVQVIASSIGPFMRDTGEDFFLKDGNGSAATLPPAHDSGNRVDMLVSDGDVPVIDPAVARGAGTDWHTARDNVAVQTLLAHLVRNRPSNLAGNGYRAAPNMSDNNNFEPNEGRTFNSEFAWRGPYLTGPVDPDPWGHRYAVNVEFLAHVSGTAGPEGNSNDVLVLSPGPDGEVDTSFAGDGIVTGDDDVITIVQGGTHS